MARFVVGLVTLCCFVSRTTFAVSVDSLLPQKRLSQSEAEYTSTNPDDRLLVRVNLLGGFRSSGVHYVPDTTNLAELISLAGGVSADADLTELYIKRRDKGAYKIMHYDLADLVKTESGVLPIVADHDVILLESRPPSQLRLQQTLAIISLVISILGSSALLYTALKK